jgi:Mn2+/Fe2+ NRAMP family transporter
MKFNSDKIRKYLLALGPGLLMAGAAIGTSHLIQSTRAGANYGFSLIFIIAIALLLKYPFFEFGPRYTIATKESLLHGYQRQGKIQFYGFLIYSFISMFITVATLFIVAAGIIANITPIPFNQITWCIIIAIVCMLILIIGRYSFLDKTIKVVMLLMCIVTVAAVTLAFAKVDIPPDRNMFPQNYWNEGGLIFIAALIGWMPAAVYISVFESLWSLARWKQTKYVPKLKEALFDFNLGYFATIIISFIFVALGALLMYGTGEIFSNDSATFAGQLTHLYTKVIGNWSYLFISIGAFLIIFSTLLTVMDAYTRVIVEGNALIFPKLTEIHKKWLYLIILCTIVIVDLFIVAYIKAGIKTMVDFATILAFLATPVLGYLNHRAVFMPHIPNAMRPGKKLRLLSITGIIFWSIFAIFYIYLIIT